MREKPFVYFLPMRPRENLSSRRRFFLAPALLGQLGSAAMGIAPGAWLIARTRKPRRRRAKRASCTVGAFQVLGISQVGQESFLARP